MIKTITYKLTNRGIVVGRATVWPGGYHVKDVNGQIVFDVTVGPGVMTPIDVILRAYDSPGEDVQPGLY